MTLDGTNTRNAFAELVARRQKHPQPCSLVELELTDGDAEQLRLWARSYATIRSARTDPAVFGMVFLATATVIAREEADENGLWSVIAQAFRASAADLFNGNDFPATDILDAIRVTTKKYSLRHALAGDTKIDGQRWRRTVLLQCAWTRSSLKNLPKWLSGATLPVAMQSLLAPGELYSESLTSLMADLVRARREPTYTPPASPWLQGSLLEHALAYARLEPLRGVSSDFDRPAAPCVLRTDHPITPRFHIPPNLPASLLCSTGSTIEFEFGSESRRAYRQQDGRFAFDNLQPVEVPIVGPGSSPSGYLTWKAHTATQHNAWLDEVMLYDPGEELDLFLEVRQNQYVRCDDPFIYELGSPRSAVLRTAKDLEVRSSGQTRLLAPSGDSGNWWHCNGEAITSMKVLLDGEPLWEPILTDRAHQGWDGELNVTPRPEVWARGRRIGWRVAFATPDVEVLRGQLGPVKLRIDRTGTGRITDLTSAPLLKLPTSNRLRLRLRCGKTTFNHSVEIDLPHTAGLLRRTADGLEPMNGVDMEAFAAPVYFFPRRLGDREPAGYLFEGERPVAQVGAKGARLGGALFGLGAPLEIRSATFNSAAAQRVSIEQSFQDQGCIQTYYYLNRRLRIRVTGADSWTGEDFGIDVLEARGHVRRHATASIVIDSGCLCVDSPEPPLALAVRFQGKVVGRTGADGFGESIKQTQGEHDVVHLVEWIHEARLPIAAPGLRGALAQLAVKSPALLLTLAASGRMAEEGISSAWRAVVRLQDVDDAYSRFFSGGHLEEWIDSKTVRSLDADGNFKCLLTAYRRIAMVDPVLANNLIAAVSHRPAVIAINPDRAKGIWESLRVQVASEFRRDFFAYKQKAASTCEAIGTSLDFLETILRRVRIASGRSDNIVRGSVDDANEVELYQLLEFADLRRFVGELNLAHLMKVPHA